MQYNLLVRYKVPILFKIELNNAAIFGTPIKLPNLIKCLISYDNIIVANKV